MQERTLLKKWSETVKERDKYECKNCGSKEKLHAHHIIPRRKNPDLKYEINNGITLCNKCHAKEEGFQKGHGFSDETKKKISESKKGKSSWNKGKKLSPKHVENLRKAHLGVPLSESHRASLIGREVWNKGLKAPEHVKKSLAEANRKTWERRKKDNLPGPRKNTTQSEEARRKMSESLKKAYAEGRRKPNGPRKKEIEHADSLNK